MVIKTKQIRILTDGVFHKLLEKIKKQFIQKHGFDPTIDQLCEAIGRAIEDNKLFK